jgi:regulator of protease activity HflC (stomatin/prohibitin superfamily)
MFGLKRITIARHERGLVFRNRSFKTVLEPGVYWSFDPAGFEEVTVYDVTNPEFTHARLDLLLQEQREVVDRYFTVVELGEREVGVVSKQGRVTGILAPGTRQLYWRGPVEVTVERVDISNEFEIEPRLARLLARTNLPAASKVAEAVLPVEVPDTAMAMLVVDGAFERLLGPGLHAFWRYQRVLKVELVDRRVQAMEVTGQEILTRDKVSLRVNLTAQWQVEDVVRARASVTEVTDSVYKALQFALRATVGARSLDELLADKSLMDREIREVAVAGLAVQGVAVRSVGVKDVILPGEMKTILNQVVEAEKRAQANLVYRREETAAMRSLLNTARLMQDNPTLMRLKELETLEKVTEKIDKLTVFGGLEGVMKDVVRIQVPGG